MAKLLRKAFKPGERLFHEGDPGEEAYLLEDGVVEISKRVADGEHVVIATLTKGSIVGEMALISAQARSATARVVKEVRCIVLTRDDFERRLEKSDAVVVRMLKIFADRLRTQTQRSADKATVVR